MVLAVHQEANRWLAYRKPNPKVRLRLFCFPYAGAGAFIYRNWAKDLPESVELCPLQPPGRETRLKEESFTDLCLLVQSVASALRPYLDLPFAFFGHSLGALVSYQVAHYLRSQYGIESAHLFVSGRYAPHLKSKSSGISKLPEPQFIEMVKKMGGTHRAVFENRELLRLILPALRADFHLCDTYQFKSELTPLRCPITALGGLQDEGVTWWDLEAWREHTSGGFTIHSFPGNHFFINTSTSALLQVLKQELQALLNSLGSNQTIGSWSG